MTSVALIVAIVLIPLAAAICYRVGRSEVDSTRHVYETLLTAERERVVELLDRVQAKSLEHLYAVRASVPEPAAPDLNRYLYDDTGLIRVAERVD